MLSFIVTDRQKQADALITTGSGNAVSINGLADVYNSSNDTWNLTAMNQMAAAAIGKSGQTVYIEDVYDYIETNGELQFGSKILKSTSTTGHASINGNLGNTDGIAIKIQNLLWQLACMSTAVINGEKTVIATVLHMNTIASMGMFGHSPTGSGNGNMYSGSGIDSYLDGTGTVTKSGLTWAYPGSTFGQKYLVLPKDVPFQYNQSSIGIWNLYTAMNEGLAQIPDSQCLNSTMNYTSNANYANWGNHYMWIPSMTEVGLLSWVAGGGTSCNTVFGLSPREHAIDGGGYWWTRTPDPNDTSAMTKLYVLSGDGNSYALANYNANYGVRPAFHINLTKILGYRPFDPLDISVNYDGNPQSLAGYMAAQTTKPTWYHSSMYTGSDAHVVVTPSATDMTNAGEYWIKIELAPAWVTARQSAGCFVGFAGTANTSDSAHMESATVRWIKYTVDKIPITLDGGTFATDNKGVVTAPTTLQVTQSSLLAHDITNNLQPTLQVRYKDTGTNGTLYDSTTPPTSPGTYQATVEISNPTVSNYKLDKDYSYTYTKGKEVATTPTIASAAQTVTYDGSVKSFAIQNYDSTVMTATPSAGMTYNSTTEEFEATNAGTYTVNFALINGTDYEWSTGGTGLQTVTVTVKPVVLTATVKKTPDPNTWSWSSGDTVSLTIDVSGVLSGETISLAINYKETGGATTSAATVTGNCTGTALASVSSFTQGAYSVEATLTSGAAGNGNYALDNTGATTKSLQAFTVGAAQIELNGVTWKYAWGGTTSASGTLDSTAVSNDYTYNAGGNLFEFVYNKENITLSIDTSALPAGVAIDTTAYTNGYDGAINKNAGSYTTKVKVKAPAGAIFKNNGGSGVKEFTVSWEIKKADFDLTNVTWNYVAANYVYNGQTQTVTLTGLPTGLTAIYSDNSKMNAGSYTATVTSFSVADTANYNVPSTTGWTLPWAIAKKKINVLWTNQQAQDSSSTVFYVPVLSDSSAAPYIVYKYYNDNSGAADTSTVLQLSDITVNTSAETKYWVEVQLDPNNQTVLDNFELDESNASALLQFTVGSNKNIVSVNIQGSGQVYDGSAHFNLTITAGSLQPNQFIIQYAPKPADGSEPASSAFQTIDLSDPSTMPVNAGKYRIFVDLSSSDSQYNYLPNKMFDFEILQAEFDVSQLVWVDAANGNAPYTGAFSYEATLKRDANGDLELDNNGNKQLVVTEHEMVLMNGNTVLTLQSDAGGNYYLVEYPLADGSNAQLKLYVTSPTAQGAGSEASGTPYKIQMNFDYDDTNFKRVEDSFDTEFEWEIQKASLDLSQVHWNYPGAFTFTADENGVAEEFSVELEGLPDYLLYTVSYTDNINSNQGNYTAVSSFVGFDMNNYEDYSTQLPPGFSTSCPWQILPRVFATPPADEVELVFRDEGYIFPDELGFDADWENYLKISLEKNYQPIDTDAHDAVFDVDIYTVEINILPAFASGNVQWADGSAAAKYPLFRIVPLVLTVNGWTTPLGENSKITVNEDLDFAKYVDYRITVESLDGEVATLPLSPNTLHYIKAIVKEAYEGNVEIAAEDGVEVYISFTTSRRPGPPPTELARPEFENDKIVYNGEDIEFKLLNFDQTFLEFTTASDALTQKDVGEYTVTIRFIKGVNAVWADTGDTTSVTLSFIVELLVLEIPTCDENALKYTGEEQEYLPNGFESKFMTIRGNTATDAGMYELTVGLIDPVNTAWKVGAESVSYKTALAWKVTLDGAGEDEKTSDKKLEWKINRAVISSNWNTEGTMPSLTLSEEEKGMIEYTFYDANGEVVPANKLRKGQQYTVQASLKDAYKNNYEFENAEVSYLSPFGDPFTFDGAGGGFSFDTLFTDWWWVILLAVLALLFIILLIVLLKRRKKKEEAVTAVAQAAPAEAPAPAPAAQTAITPAPAQQAIPAPERVYIQAEHAPMPPMNQQGMAYGYPNGVNPMLQQQQMMAQQMQQQQMQMQQHQMDMEQEKLMHELQKQKMQTQQLMMQLRAQQMQPPKPVQPAPAPAPAPTAPAAPASPQVIVIDVDK